MPDDDLLPDDGPQLCKRCETEEAYWDWGKYAGLCAYDLWPEDFLEPWERQELDAWMQADAAFEEARLRELGLY